MDSIKYRFLTLSIVLIFQTSTVLAAPALNETFLNSFWGASAFSIRSQKSEPTLTTEKLEYLAGDTVVIRGQGFGKFEMVSLSVETAGGSLQKNDVLAQWNVYADGQGRFSATLAYDSLRSTDGRFIVKAFGTETKGEAETSFSSAVLAIGINIEQCANGPISAPIPCNTSSANDGYTRGNLIASKAHYKEGDSVPIRLVATDLTVGQTYTVTFGYDYTKGGMYAVDYLTDYDRTESVNNNPCVDVVGCTLASRSDFPIPTDPEVTAGFDQILGTADDITQISGNFSIFGGTITNVSGYTRTGSTAGDSSKFITVTFTANQTNVVIAYGSHISTRADWGVANSAINISGSPYHNFVQDFPGANQGNRDLQLAAEAVIFPATITVIKDSQPNSVLDFSFTATGPNGSTPQAGVSPNFILDDDAGVPGADSTYSNTISFSDLVLFGSTNSVTITEAPGGGSYSLTQISCVSNPNGGSGVDNNTINVQSRFATIVLEEGESVTCTFVNAVTTAASASVGGVVLDGTGQPIARTRVTIQNTVTLETRTVYTNMFGRYQFDELAVGDFYVVTVANRKYVFSPDTHGFVLNDAVEDLNFMASPE